MPFKRFALLYSHYCIAVIICLCCTFGANAQISNTGAGSKMVDNQKVISDTLGFAEKALDQSVRIFYQDQRGERMEYDTSISDMHLLGLLNPWQIDLGNTGSAYQSLRATAELPVSYTMLPNGQAWYRFLKKDIRLYNTTKPFSQVRYSVGSKQEQLVELFHTQNIKPNWNFSTNYRKINSLGFFKAQKNNIDNFSFISHYTSKNNRYRAVGALLYNKIQQDENLGILADSLLELDQFSNRSLVPVGVNVGTGITRSPILNFNRDLNFSMRQEYSIGKKGNDTLTDSYAPLLTFGNEIYYEGERYRFQHYSPDSIFRMTYFGQPFDTDDSLEVRYDGRLIGTNFSAEGNLSLGQRIFSLKAGLGVEYQKVSGRVEAQSAVNNYVFGELTNRKSQDSSWRLDAQMQLYYTGLAKGNLNLSGRLSKQLPNEIGEIGIDAGQYIQQPFFVSESIQVAGTKDVKSFQSQINSKLGGYYLNKKWRLRASIHSLLLNNLIFSQGLNPSFKQYNSAISIQQVQVQKDVVFGLWTFSNRALVQIAPKNTPVQLPIFSSFHRLAYSSYLFKGKMEASTGLDVYCNTPYFYDNYQAVFQSFTPQYSLKQKMIPRLNPFFNFRVKRFRASVSFDQVQHFLIKNNLNYIHYPSQNPVLRFALRWIFVN